MKLSLSVVLFIACMAMPVTSMACEFKQGETLFADYAKCRYGEDAITVVQLPARSAFEQCIYHEEAFRPPKLLAVTRMENGKEVLSLNDRSKIGNPCYMTKSQCDAVLKASKE